MRARGTGKRKRRVDGEAGRRAASGRHEGTVEEGKREGEQDSSPRLPSLSRVPRSRVLTIASSDPIISASLAIGLPLGHGIAAGDAAAGMCRILAKAH